MSIRLTPAEFAATVAKIEKINARAVAKGFTGLLAVEGERVEVTKVDEVTGLDITEVFFETSVTGEAPSYGGWTFVARVDSVGDTFTLATAPGVEHVSREGIEPGTCQHCKTNRARKTTYIVRNAEGEQVQVGSTCLKDFLGWDASVVFFSADDVEREVGGFAGTGERTFSTLTILAAAHAATRAFGWVPASSYEGRPTRDWVGLVIGAYRPSAQEEKALPALREFAAEAAERAVVVRDFILSDAFSGTSSYVDNLKVAAAQEAVTYKQVGLLASAPNAYVRHLETEVERQARLASYEKVVATSDFIGAVGDKKVRVEGVISSIRYISNAYGTTVLYTITTTEGNVVKWFASREALGEKEGRKVVVEGTVKSHTVFNEIKQTVITRAKEIVNA